MCAPIRSEFADSDLAEFDSRYIDISYRTRARSRIFDLNHHGRWQLSINFFSSTIFPSFSVSERNCLAEKKKSFSVCCVALSFLNFYFFQFTLPFYFVSICFYDQIRWVKKTDESISFDRSGLLSPLPQLFNLNLKSSRVIFFPLSVVFLCGNTTEKVVFFVRVRMKYTKINDRCFVWWSDSTLTVDSFINSFVHGLENTQLHVYLKILL